MFSGNGTRTMENASLEGPSLVSLTEFQSHNRSLGDLLRVLEGWRTKYNISVVQECAHAQYCGGELRDLVLAYNGVHGYVSLLICFFGSLANALNVAVLTRRDLAAAPINRLLKWLAVADVLVMLEYVPFAVYRYLLLPGREEWPYSWALYTLFHMHWTQVMHTAAILLTLSLAVWRYIAIKYPSRSPTFCTDRRCSVAIVASFALPPLLDMPSYGVFTIHTNYAQSSDRVLRKVYFVDSDYNGSLYQINFWVHAVLIKLLPCLILTVISAWLIRALYRANSRKKALKGYSACATAVSAAGAVRAVPKRSKAERRTDRTTRMLLAVLILFLLTEFPQGILEIIRDLQKIIFVNFCNRYLPTFFEHSNLGLLSGLLGRCFFKRCYDLFGELMDALALLNGAINFVLYCSMSRQFRTTFGAMVRTRCAAAPRRAASHTELQTTYV